MRRLTVSLLFAIAAAMPVQAADRDHLTVVELYQSQGCSSCPPADLVLNAIADRPDVLALSFAVTYWDDLGWKDTFAQASFTRRQWDYAHAGNRGQVATPQVIVNGRGVLTGNRRADVDAAVTRFDRGAAGPVITIQGHDAIIGEGRPMDQVTAWLVRYDPRTIAVPIRAGENGGRTIAHRNIVRALVPLGPWRGAPLRVAIPTDRDGLAGAILLQQGVGGPIVAARRI
jgi:hypothetical protein